MQSTLQTTNFSHGHLAQTIIQRYSFSENEIVEGSALCHMSRAQLVEELAMSIEDPSRREAELFMPYNVNLLVDYLYKSHRYYLDKLLPEIGNTLHQVIKLSPDEQWFSRYALPLFQRYVADTVAHFAYEEHQLFPYALRLAGGSIDNESYSAGEFLASHPHSDISLEKVISVLTSNEASFRDNIAYRILIKRLRHLEEDMHLHSIIEDEVLVVKLQQLERQKMAGL